MKLVYWAGHIGNKFGAYEKYILLLAKQCLKYNISFSVVHEETNNYAFYRNQLDSLGANYFELPHTLNSPGKGFISAIHLFQSIKPDIVHFNFINPLIIPMAKLINVPIVYRTCHNGLFNITIKTKLSRILNNFFVDRFFAVSKRVLQDEIEAGVKPEKITINYLGLPLDYYNTAGEPAIEEPLPKYCNNPKFRKIITIGRFFPEKGMKFVVKVACEIVKNNNDLLWWFIGGIGPDYEYCVKYVKEKKLSHKVFFLGQRNDVPGLLRFSQLQVIGSEFEGLGLNILEASLFKIPTIAPNIGGVNEAILNLVTGLLIEPHNINEFISSINYLLSNSETRIKFGNKANEYIMMKYNSIFSINELINFYKLDSL